MMDVLVVAAVDAAVAAGVLVTLGVPWQWVYLCKCENNKKVRVTLTSKARFRFRGVQDFG